MAYPAAVTKEMIKALRGPSVMQRLKQSNDARLKLVNKVYKKNAPTAPPQYGGWGQVQGGSTTPTGGSVYGGVGVYYGTMGTPTTQTTTVWVNTATQTSSTYVLPIGGYVQPMHDPALANSKFPLLTLEKKNLRALRKATWQSMDLAQSDNHVESFTRIVEGWVVREGEVYALPDGALLKVDDKGNYFIEDTEAKVVYKANRVREFNPYMNASDLLEDFIRDLGKLGVTQSGLLKVPVMAFIHWLAIQAALKDGEPTDDLPPVQQALPPPPPGTTPPRCNYCGRYIKLAWAKAHVLFCTPAHMQRKMEALGNG